MPPDFSSCCVYTILKYVPPPLGACGVDTEISACTKIVATVTSFPVGCMGMERVILISFLPAGKVGFLWSSNEL